MAGRKLASIIGLAVGLFSFFMPLVVVSMAADTELKWSGYSVLSQFVGFSSEHFWDIAAELVYGSGSETDSKSADPGSTSNGGEGGVVAGFTMLITTGISYCILIVLAVVIGAKFSPRRVSRLSVAGIIAASVALISFFVLADTSVAHYGGAAERDVLRLDAGVGQYLLLTSFAILFIVQRLAVLDRAFATPE